LLPAHGYNLNSVSKSDAGANEDNAICYTPGLLGAQGLIFRKLLLDCLDFLKVVGRQKGHGRKNPVLDGATATLFQGSFRTD
jgi:hypothetical protein